MNDRLSNIVDEMAKGSMSELMSRPVRVAIAQKYQKMEEALKAFRQNADEHDDGCARVTKEVLDHLIAFDPLNS